MSSVAATQAANPVDDNHAARRLVFARSVYSRGSQQRLSLRVPDIRCAACSLGIEKHLAARPDVVQVNTNLADKRVSVDFSSGEPLDFVEDIESLGYTVVPDRPNQTQALLDRERKTMLARLGVAGIGMMQVMMFALTEYVAGTEGIAPAYESLMRWASLAMATPVVLYSALPFHKGALRDLRNRYLGMDVPISLAILAAYSLSLLHTLTDSGAVYFDSACMFTFFLLIGRYIELGSRQKYQLSQNLNDNLLPAVVKLASYPGQNPHQNGPHHVAADQVPVGAILRVGAGEVIPVDAVVVSGQASVDESAFTGESTPRTRSEGMRVLAGARLVDGELLLECTTDFDDFVLTRIANLYKDASLFKPRFSQLADAIAGYFVGFVLIAAFATALFWWQAGAANWFSIALAVLVVSCPCALSLATPVAYTVAIAGLRERGVVVSNGALMERLANITAIVFDKTGTVTCGALKIAHVQPINPAMSHAQILAIAAALEAVSRHPIATAFAGHGKGLCVLDPQLHPGDGVSGSIDGEQYRLGKPVFAAEQTLTPPVDAATSQGTWILLASDTPQAWIQLTDELRPEAAAVMSQLADQGYPLALLTGDTANEAQRIARKLGINDITADTRPEDKLALIQQQQAKGARPLMVGDGINDAAAMSSAHASIAVSPVDVVVQQAADATLLTNSLDSLPALISYAKRVRRIIRQNVGWAVAYNMSLIPLAASGVLQPWVAALGMSLSSLMVVFNANRLRRE